MATTVALALTVAAWSVAVVVIRLGLGLSSVPHRAVDGLLLAVPVATVAVAVRQRRMHPLAGDPGWRLSAWWTAILAAALFLTPVMLAHSTVAWAVPGALAAAWLMNRWPALGLGAVLLVTATFGSIGAYTHFPYARAVDLFLLGLWLAALARLTFAVRTNRLFVWPGLAALILYLGATVAEISLSPSTSAAFKFSRTTHWFMLAVLLVVYSQWSRATHLRIARTVCAAGLLVGAYAVIQTIRGPTTQELAQEATSIYNFVNGKPKVTGSLPNGSDLGTWTALMIPFCLSCALGLRGRVRLVCAAAIPLMAIGLLGSGMRAAGVAVLIAAPLILILHQVSRAFPGARLGRGAIALVTVVAVAFGAYLVVGPRANPLSHGYSGLLSFGSNRDASVVEHRYKWEAALRDLSGHPFGYGIGAAPTGYSASLSPGGGSDSPADTLGIDNGYLEIALQQGLIVMAVFVAALVLLLGGLARRGVASSDPLRATVAIGAAGTLVSLLVIEGSGAFIDGMPALAGWTVIGLGIAQFMPSSESQGRPGGAPFPDAALGVD